ncbi:hypothetical protein J5Y03_07960 [Bacillus sp. RG28]|uniref:Uncharacterized protein n=1 Tax=Gottfriedia endophytica TaxID=2820819 RepID=A0A940NQP8_9BACI|nr:hypothetical protein [Gottfriedia endophytica]MBP0725126.1 hypothetical protein [Gottfriedia endophytica]
MEILISLLYFFHEFLDANLDLFYLLALVLIFKDFINSKKRNLEVIKYMYVIILYGCLQIVLNPDIILLRLIINLAKMYINLFLFVYVKEMIFDLKFLRNIVYKTSFLFLLFIPISLVFKVPMLWRMNDFVNSYNQTRLKLFYYEPSELSFHAALVAVLLISFLLLDNNAREKRKIILYLISNSLLIVLSAGMGGIVSLVLGIVTIYLYKLVKSFNIKRILISFLLFFVSVSTLIYLMYSKNNFYLRVVDIFNGKDGSVVYRFNTSYEVMVQMLQKTNGLGVGFGNLNTDLTRSIYSAYGLVDVISNSFMYFIGEGGIISIVTLLFLLLFLLRRIKKEEGILKYGLLVFIVIYQVAGGYYTNPVNWIVYGIICNNYFMKTKGERL